MIIAAAIFILHKMQASKEKAFDQGLSQLENFSPSYIYVSTYSSSGIAIDAVREKVAVSNGGGYPLSVFDASVINGISILKNNATIHKTNRGGQIAGIAVGGVLLGPIGMLVGGLSSSKRTVEKVQRLSIRITTNDISNPIHEIVFYSSPGQELDSLDVRQQVEQIELWNSRLRALMSE